jgi:hypothetical protein
MTLETRVQALLDLVETDRSRRCAALAREAQARANATRAAARTAARERLRTAFKEERQRREARLAAARAKLQTHRRLQQQRSAAALLAVAWQRLPQILCERWLSPTARQAWVMHVVAEARAAFAAGSWRIVHEATWPTDEREQLRAALTRELGAEAQFFADAAIRAGLRISAGGNVIDGTLSGLLADRTEIGARLLRHVEDA